jgi:hypothetical protein
MLLRTTITRPYKKGYLDGLQGKITADVTEMNADTYSNYRQGFSQGSIERVNYRKELGLSLYD